jgi:ketosteroid isomerase-like protein
VRQVGAAWVMRINPDAGDVRTDDYRDVPPLHEHLIATGFIDFLQRSTPGHLFCNGGKDGSTAGPADGVYKRVYTMVRGVVTDEHIQPNHAWRYTFKTHAYDAGLNDLTVDAICGHAARTQGEAYRGVTGLEGSMRLASAATLCLLSVLETPMFAADDQSSKRDVEKIAAAYKEHFDKQNSAGLVALFTNDGVLVSPTGAHTDLAHFMDGAFKAGMNQIKITVEQASTVDADKDSMIGIGEYQMTGKNSSRAAMEDRGRWTATYVREGATWKIRMLTGFPAAPPPS